MESRPCNRYGIPSMLPLWNPVHATVYGIPLWNPVHATVRAANTFFLATARYQPVADADIFISTVEWSWQGLVSWTGLLKRRAGVIEHSGHTITQNLLPLELLSRLAWGNVACRHA